MYTNEALIVAAGRKYDFFDACAMHHIKESLLQFAEMEQAYSRTSEPSPPQSPPASVCSSSQKVENAAKLAGNPNLATASLRRSGRRKVALTDKLQEASSATAVELTTTVATAVALRELSDSGCSSLPEKTILESFVRAYRTTPSGERQMLISYYTPKLEEAEAPT